METPYSLCSFLNTKNILYSREEGLYIVSSANKIFTYQENTLFFNTASDPLPLIKTFYLVRIEKNNLLLVETDEGPLKLALPSLQIQTEPSGDLASLFLPNIHFTQKEAIPLPLDFSSCLRSSGLFITPSADPLLSPNKRKVSPSLSPAQKKFLKDLLQGQIQSKATNTSHSGTLSLCVQKLLLPSATLSGPAHPKLRSIHVKLSDASYIVKTLSFDEASFSVAVDLYSLPANLSLVHSGSFSFPWPYNKPPSLLSFSFDGPEVFLGTRTGLFVSWDPSTSRTRKLPHLEAGVIHAQTFRNGHTAIGLDDGSVLLLRAIDSAVVGSICNLRRPGVGRSDFILNRVNKSKGEGTWLAKQIRRHNKRLRRAGAADKNPGNEEATRRVCFGGKVFTYLQGGRVQVLDSSSLREWLVPVFDRRPIYLFAPSFKKGKFEDEALQKILSTRNEERLVSMSAGAIGKDKEVVCLVFEKRYYFLDPQGGERRKVRRDRDKLVLVKVLAGERVLLEKEFLNKEVVACEFDCGFEGLLVFLKDSIGEVCGGEEAGLTVLIFKDRCCLVQVGWRDSGQKYRVLERGEGYVLEKGD